MSVRGVGSLPARGTRYVAPYKRVFGADHVPVVSSGHSGFLHHQKGPIPPMSWVGVTPSAVLSPGRVA
jgi:hypothetical protein